MFQGFTIEFEFISPECSFNENNQNALKVKLLAQLFSEHLI
jgi:hypothetical protein